MKATTVEFGSPIGRDASKPSLGAQCLDLSASGCGAALRLGQLREFLESHPDKPGELELEKGEGFGRSTRPTW